MSYIHSASKHRRSGNAMQKMPRRGQLSRAQRARQILPGYPWDGHFTTREQVADYLSGDRIACLLCGKTYELLAPHVRRIHGLPIEEYKARFGIPQNQGCASADFREHSSRLGLAQAAKLRKMQPEGVAAAVVAMSKEAPTPRVEFYRRELVDRMLDMPRKGKVFGDGAGDFAWHIATLSTVWWYRRLKPPAGLASWQTFDKRRWSNQALNAEYKAARAECRKLPIPPVRSSLTPADREIMSEGQRRRWARSREQAAEDAAGPTRPTDQDA